MYGGLKGVDERTLMGIVEDLYPDPPSLRDLARRAGLRSDHVTKGETAEHNSKRVVYAAGFSGFGGVSRLLREMSNDFPDHPYLNAWILGDTIPSGPLRPERIPEWNASLDERRPIVMYEWLERGVQAGKATVRVDMAERRGMGTGIVLDGVWLATAAQYIPDQTAARQARIDFGYEAHGKAHYRQRLAPGEGFAADPALNLSICCITGGAQPAPDYSLDYAGQASVGTPCQAIGHPAGMHKTIIPYGGVVLATVDDFFYFSTYGIPATEGMPVFNEGWDLLGITVSSGWLRQPYPLYGNMAVYVRHVEELLEKLERGNYGSTR